MKEHNSLSLLKKDPSLKKIFFILFALIIFSLLYLFRSFLWPFLFALIFYLPLRPLHEKIKEKIKSRSLSSGLVILSLFILIIVPTFFLLTALADQTYQLYLFMQKKVSAGIFDDFFKNPFAQSILSFFDFKDAEIIKKITDLTQKAAGWMVSNLTSLLSFPINFSVKFIFMLLMLFALLKDGYKLDQTIYEILPFPLYLEKKVISRLKEVIQLLLLGNFFIMILQGFMLGLGFFIAGLKMPLLWGSLAAILSLIPVIGTSLIWIPATIFLLISHSYGWAIFLSSWSLFWFLFLENLLKPKVFGEKLHFYPLVFFFLLIGSIQTFNLHGVLIGPILLTLGYSFGEIYKDLKKIN